MNVRPEGVFFSVEYDEQMLREITDAIVQAIHNHEETALSAIFGITGTLLGLVLAFLFERWRNGGKVTAKPLMYKISYHGDKSSRDPTDVPNLSSVIFKLELRFLNSFTVPKSLTIDSADITGSKLRRILLPSMSRMLGIAFESDASHPDLQLDPQSFSRVFVSGRVLAPGHKFEQEGHTPIDLAIIKEIKWIKLVFTIAPKTKLVVPCEIMPSKFVDGGDYFDSY